MSFLKDVYENMSPDALREFLRELQKNPYQWPNLYFAWEKPDKTLFMIGTKSTQMFNILKHEVSEISFINSERTAQGLPMEYETCLCGISPTSVYMVNNERYDPVERLVEQVSSFKYIGFWEDPDVLMDDKWGYNRVLACGRFELAKEKIGVQRSLDERLQDATGRSVWTGGAPDREFDYN